MYYFLHITLKDVLSLSFSFMALKDTLHLYAIRELVNWRIRVFVFLMLRSRSSRFLPKFSQLHFMYVEIISPHIYVTYFLADSWSKRVKIAFKDALPMTLLPNFSMKLGIYKGFGPILRQLEIEFRSWEVNCDE